MSENLLTLSSLEICLVCITGGLFVIQLLYALVAYARPVRAVKNAERDERTTTGRNVPVSIIVYTHGEPENLKKNLPALLTQDYPEYEVIVVNDGSDDESEDVLKILSSEYKHLYYTFVPNDTQYLSHKKLALTMGIKAAKYDTLLFTESGCHPVSNQWISSMTRGYAKQTEIRLGFCSYPFHKGMMHKMIAYDNLQNGLRYLSSALARHPYSGNGCNLSYRKELFFSQKGFSKSLNLHAGADDLFVNNAATPENTQVEYSANSLMETGEMEDYETWKGIKVSRAATQPYYKGFQLAFYQMEVYGYLLFLIAASVSIVTGILGNWLVALFAGLLLIIRCAVRINVFRKAAILLHQRPLTAWLPLLEINLIAYDLYIHIYRNFKGKRDYTSWI